MKKLSVSLLTILLVFVTAIAGIACGVSAENENGIADTTVPVISDINTSSISTPIAVLSCQPTCTVNYRTADIIVAGTDIVSYKYKLDCDTWSVETPVSTHIIFCDLADGLHTISVVGKDTAGNWQTEASSTTASWTVDTTTSSTIVTFPDTNLEAAIREAIGKSQGDIYRSDLVCLNNLTAKNRGIINLTGLEHCASLTTLNLDRNQISDLSPLSSLTSLTWLDLSNNQISDLSPLTPLTCLAFLHLYDNQISDLSPLSFLTSLTILYLGINYISDIFPLTSLTSLTYLHLGSNQISNLLPLSSLTCLTELRLDGNQISDIETLVNNRGLGQGDSIDLKDNPLNAISVNTYIPTLEARGVIVSYSPVDTTTPNKSPTIISPGMITNVNVTLGHLVTLPVSAYDADNDSLTYSASNLPSGANFDTSTHIFSWMPIAVGTYSGIVFSVTDGTSSPDSKTISITVIDPAIFTGKIVFHSAFEGNNEIYVMDAGGTNRIRLTNNSANDSAPEWSPDGTKIAFSSNRDGNSEIYVMNADGSNPTRLTHNAVSDMDPTWSPDGSKIAFISDRDGASQLWVMQSDGSSPLKLNSITASAPAWSPDGSKITFISHPFNGAYLPIAFINPDGTGLTDQSQANFNTRIAWSPDSKKIAIVSSMMNTGGIMNVDGSGGFNLGISGVGDLTWSPDGSQLCYNYYGYSWHK